MNDLTQSLKERGQLIPILVRRISAHRYKVIDGHLRCSALKKIGMSSVICQIEGEEGTHDIPLIQVVMNGTN